MPKIYAEPLAEGDNPQVIFTRQNAEGMPLGPEEEHRLQFSGWFFMNEDHAAIPHDQPISERDAAAAVFRYILDRYTDRNARATNDPNFAAAEAGGGNFFKVFVNRPIVWNRV